MNVYLTAPAMLLALLVQTSLLASFSPTLLRPDLLLLFIVPIGTITGVGSAIAWSIPAGLLLDVSSAAPFGAHSASLLLVALLTAARDFEIIDSRLVLSLALTLFGTFVYSAAFLLILQLSGFRVEWLTSLVQVVLPVAILNTTLLPVMYWVTRRLAGPQPLKSGTFSPI